MSEATWGNGGGSAMPEMPPVDVDLRRVTIFEGPDGSGKTTIAKAFARATQAMLVHHGSYLNVGPGLLRSIYEMSMEPALNMMCDVVLDRCWLSEFAYGPAVRGGVRLDEREVRSMERLALMQSTAVVVLCLPPFDVCAETFLGRPQEEYVKKLDQLKAIWESYAEMKTTLPVVRYDRTKEGRDLDGFVKALAAGGRS